MQGNGYVASGSESVFFEKCTGRQTIHEGRIIRVYRDDIVLPDGNAATREVVEHIGGVGIVAIDDASNVLLVRQYRYPIGRELIEIPAGTLTRGENPAHCGMRELSEETGAQAGSFESLGTILTAPGFSNQTIHLYLARQLTFGSTHLDADEFLSVDRMPLRQLVRLCLTGEIDDAKTVAGVLKAWAMLQGEL